MKLYVNFICERNYLYETIGFERTNYFEVLEILSMLKQYYRSKGVRKVQVIDKFGIIILEMRWN